jgi:hypothetical protein
MILEVFIFARQKIKKDNNSHHHSMPLQMRQLLLQFLFRISNIEGCIIGLLNGIS